MVMEIYYDVKLERKREREREIPFLLRGLFLTQTHI